MSKLITNTIRHVDGSNDNITLDSSQNVTVEGNLTVDGTCTAKITNQPPGNRNKIINGAMTINQRSHSGAAGNNAYTLDRWKYQRSANAEFDVVQSTEKPHGFANSLRLDCTTGNGTVGAGDYVKLRYHIEGFNVQDFAKGTASAKKFALSFYFKTSITGVYSLLLQDSNSRIVTATYTVSDTNWNRYSIILPADTTGTLNNDNSAELSIEFNIIAGSNRTSGTDLRTAWGSYAEASEAVGHTANPGSSASNNVYITGVQLEVGDVATEFEMRSYGDELARCERYYQVLGSGAAYYIGNCNFYQASQVVSSLQLRVTMRDTPSIDQTTGTDYYRVYSNNTYDAFDGFTGTSAPSKWAAGFWTNGTATGTIGHAGIFYISHGDGHLAMEAEL